jgi:hypothetical protein
MIFVVVPEIPLTKYLHDAVLLEIDNVLLIESVYE